MLLKAPINELSKIYIKKCYAEQNSGKEYNSFQCMPETEGKNSKLLPDSR